MRRNIFLFFLLLTTFNLYVSAQVDSTAIVLDELDKVIQHKSIYFQKKERILNDLKLKARKNYNKADRYHIYNAIFEEYLHYQADSALAYVEKQRGLLKYISTPAHISEIKINASQVYGLMGMYNETGDLIRDIDVASLDKDLLDYYYRTCRAYYGWLADYTTTSPEKNKYMLKTNQYRDSIIFINNNIIDKTIVEAEKYTINGRPDSSLILLNTLLNCSSDRQQQAYIYYTISNTYEAMDDRDKQIYYLARTAIVDLENGTREYASLQRLALVLYEKGDINRAYKYLICSMEDAVACNARLRFIEVTKIFPIIDKSYRIKESKSRFRLNVLLISVSILSLFLVAAIFYLYIWMKRLSRMRKNLSITNNQLYDLNKKLKEIGHIKEVYIGRYLDRCVTYLDKLEQYRRSLAKLAMSSRMDELFTAIKSEQFIRDERKDFYSEFDKSFIELFPHFIDEFNSLLVEDARIYPKSGEILTTELRIFALIRLGVTDSNSIAHFLGYSLATIYNYRSKLRNKAIGDKDDFENAVMKL